MRHLLPLLLGLSLLASSTVRADSSHLDRVLAARELRVCVWPDYYGNSYRNPHTQEMTGVDADMARAFAKDLGMTLRFVDNSFALLVNDVTRDRCDVAMFAIGITPAKAETLRFTRAHLMSEIQAIAAAAAMEDMTSEARMIFSYFASHDAAAAGTRMATMDRKYAQLNAALASLSAQVYVTQRAHFDEQLGLANSLRSLEVVIACGILFMVLGALVYGHRLGRQVDIASAAKEQSIRDTAAAQEATAQGLKIKRLHEEAQTARAWCSAGKEESRSQARSSTWLRTALCTRGAPLGVLRFRAAALSAGTGRPSNSAPVRPFDAGSVVMLVMPKDMQHLCR